MLAQAASQPVNMDELIRALHQASGNSSITAWLLGALALFVAALRPQLGQIVLAILNRPQPNGSARSVNGTGNPVSHADLERVADTRTATIVNAVDRSGTRIENAVARLTDVISESTKENATFTAKIEAALNVMREDQRDARIAARTNHNT